jgi:hypothetical protein
VALMADGSLPQTAREALYEVRRRCELMRGSDDIRYLHTSDAEVALTHLRAINAVAKAGLDRTEPINFELSDQLADRLAEAHQLLSEIRGSDSVAIRGWWGKIDEALSLPPDLETIVERRVR